MIIGIGCDIVEHDMTRTLGWDSDTTIQQKIFTSKELEEYHKKPAIKFLAGRFAAKEALVKSLGVGMHDGISLANIEILDNELGKPALILTGEIKKISDELGIESFELSISHSTRFSFAVVVAQKQP